MVSEERIRAELNRTLQTVEIPELGTPDVGKVRTSYKLGDRRIIVTSDRISAFDRVLGTIPFKGQVLNQLAAFWFEHTRADVPNHVLDVPDPNVMVVRECRQLPLELIVRGYITGVTKTSLWTHYARGLRNYCGNPLPDNLQKNQKLPAPILTPTTKLEEHDRPISRAEAVAEGLLSAELFDEAARMVMRLYEDGVQQAARQGLILVDTKYELGLWEGRLLVTDEIHTPDSSRYWFADSYADLFSKGAEPRQLDKEYVRRWFADQGFRGEGQPPAMTDTVRIEAARRYIQAYEIITGQEFIPGEAPALARIRTGLRAAGYLRT